MKFGGSFENKEQEKPALSESERRVFDKLVPEMEAARIKLENFKRYDQATVERDIKYTEEKTAEFAASEGPEGSHASLAEAIIWNGINSGWLGDEARSIVPSKYEDITKGVDNVVRFEKKTGIAHLALAIDVTEGLSEVDKKIEKILGEIAEGKLTTLEYFESKSPHGVGYQGALENIPKVVVASNKRSVTAVADRLAKLWELTEKAGKNPSPADQVEIEKLKRSVSGSQLKMKMLFEIREQLAAYSRYAKDNNRPSLCGPHDRALNIISEIIDGQMPAAKREEILKEISKDETVAALFAKLKDGRKKPTVFKPAVPPKPKERWK